MYNSGGAFQRENQPQFGPMARQYGPNGCEVPLNGGKCGETKTLRIINEFKELYEEKMMQIDAIAGGDCSQAKIKLQQEWIHDLTNQNELLVRAVEELELEATERVRMLEEKVRANANLTYEVMRKYRDFDFPVNLDEHFQKLNNVQNDISNLLEFIRRIREEGAWNMDGLHFYQVGYEDLFGPDNQIARMEDDKALESDPHRKIQKLMDDIKVKDRIISKLEEQLDNNQRLSDEDNQLRKANQEFADLKKSMKDMRDALTAEVADKHDIIVGLRREIVHLEEQCRKADQQTHFKDDIIKELRKEIKQLKQHIKFYERNKSRSRVPKLQLPKPSTPDPEYSLCGKGNSINLNQELHRSPSTSPVRHQGRGASANQAVIYMKQEREERPRVRCYTIPIDEIHYETVCASDNNQKEKMEKIPVDCTTLYINPDLIDRRAQPCKHTEQIQKQAANSEIDTGCSGENKHVDEGNHTVAKQEPQGILDGGENIKIPNLKDAHKKGGVVKSDTRKSTIQKVLEAELVKMCKPRTKFTDTDVIDTSQQQKCCPQCLQRLENKRLKSVNVFQVIPLRAVLDLDDLKLKENKRVYEKKNGYGTTNLNNSI